MSTQTQFNNFNSSFLSGAAYDAVNEIVTVYLRNGAEYSYRIVPAAWAEFISAESAGAYFSQFIRPHADRV